MHGAAGCWQQSQCFQKGRHGALLAWQQLKQRALGSVPLVAAFCAVAELSASSQEDLAVPMLQWGLQIVARGDRSLVYCQLTMELLRPCCLAC